MIPLGEEENKSHHEQKVCCICKDEFSTDDTKVKVHCHFNGKYRGATHSVFNLNYRAKNKFQ